MKSKALRHLRSKLATGEPLFGLWVTLESASVTEMAVALGMDWVVIDAEHGHLDWKEINEHVRAGLHQRREQGFHMLGIGSDSGLMLRSIHQALQAVGRDRMPSPSLDPADGRDIRLPLAHPGLSGFVDSLPPIDCRGRDRERSLSITSMPNGCPASK